MDGNYAHKLGTLVSDRADLVVWLDLPLRTCLFRATRRSVARIRARTELWNGNRDTWRGVFWGRNSLVAYSVRERNAIREAIATTVPAEKLLRLRSDADVRRFLASD